MTLCIGWFRKIGDSSEICVVADSCLSGGQRFLAAPKLFPLPRKDGVIACAGFTGYSFPIVEHILHALGLNQKLRDQAADFTDVVHLIEDIANLCLHEGQEPNVAMQGAGPDFSMLIAGYSWRMKSHLLKVLSFDWTLRKMNAANTSTIKGIPFAVIGDNVRGVRHRIFQYLEEKQIDANNINMEPLDVLFECINNPSSDHRSIGGNPQMVKVYPYQNVLPFGFLHRQRDLNGNINGDTFISYYGRPLLPFETFPYPIYDLEKGEIQFMYQRSESEDFKRYHKDVKPLRGFDRMNNE